VLTGARAAGCEAPPPVGVGTSDAPQVGQASTPAGTEAEHSGQYGIG
jgi:hypothetical protein